MLQCAGSEQRSVSCVNCQRAALLCVRGSRTPWYKENTKAVSEDFRLTVHEAGLDLRISDDDKRDEE